MENNKSVQFPNGSYDNNLDFTTGSTAKLSDLNSANNQKLNRLAKDPDMEAAYNPFENRDALKALSFSGALIHMLKSSLGSGILAMPNAFKNAGLVLGFFGTILVGILCSYCVYMLVRCSQVLSRRTRTPCLNFADTVYNSFQYGPARYRKWDNVAKRFVNIALFSTYYLGNTVYVVFIASSFKQVIDNHAQINLNIRWYILLTCVPLLPIASVRQLRKIEIFSALANGFMFVGIAFTLYFSLTDLPDTSTRHKVAPLVHFPIFFSTVLFAMEGIGTVLTIENSMVKPKFLGNFGVLNVAMFVVITVYSAVGFCGYLKYGDDTKGSITLNLPQDIFSELIKVLVALSILLTYGLQFAVPTDIVWEKLEPKISIPRQTVAYYVMRAFMIMGTVLIAAIIPNLGPIISLVGAVCFSILGLFCPAVVDYMAFYKEESSAFCLRNIKNLVIILISLFSLVAGTYASIEEISEFYAKNPFF